MTEMIQTPSGDYIHPGDFVRRRRWAGGPSSPALITLSHTAKGASSEAP